MFVLLKCLCYTHIYIFHFSQEEAGAQAHSSDSIEGFILVESNPKRWVDIL